MSLMGIIRAAPSGRAPLFLHTAASLERGEIEALVDGLIAMLDRRDGDCDDEDNSDSEDVAAEGDLSDQAAPEWAGWSVHRYGVDGALPDALLEDSEDSDSDLCVDDRGECGNWPEADGDRFGGSPIGDDEQEDDGWPIRRPHRNRIRRTRCDHTPRRLNEWTLRERVA